MKTDTGSREEALTGRELDAAVAERVMGVKLTRAPLIPRTANGNSVFTDDGADAWYQAYPDSIAIKLLPRYSTDIAAAMEVLATLRAKGWSADIAMYPEDYVVSLFRFGDSDETRSQADSAWRSRTEDERGDVLATLICRAALAAVASE